MNTINRVFITGDTHGKFDKIHSLCEKLETTKDDVIIILGDAGINYSGKTDQYLKSALQKMPITFFCIHGNHEKRPESIDSYNISEFCGGKVYIEDSYPNLIFAKDGEIYDFNGKKYIVIGGAYSVDKFYRLMRGWNWFADEQPSEKTKKLIEEKLQSLDWSIHGVLSHTCPRKYEPIEVFLPMIDQSSVDKSTEDWLDQIEDKLTYNKWYCGHYHTNKSIDKLRFMFDDIDLL